jgi:hypothetical protein
LWSDCCPGLKGFCALRSVPRLGRGCEKTSPICASAWSSAMTVVWFTAGLERGTCDVDTTRAIRVDSTCGRLRSDLNCHPWEPSRTLQSLTRLVAATPGFGACESGNPELSPSVLCTETTCGSRASSGMEGRSAKAGDCSVFAVGREEGAPVAPACCTCGCKALRTRDPLTLTRLPAQSSRSPRAFRLAGV